MYDCCPCVHGLAQWFHGPLVDNRSKSAMALLMILKSNLEIAHMTVKQEDNGMR